MAVSNDDARSFALFLAPTMSFASASLMDEVIKDYGTEAAFGAAAMAFAGWSTLQMLTGQPSIVKVSAAARSDFSLVCPSVGASVCALIASAAFFVNHPVSLAGFPAASWWTALDWKAIVSASVLVASTMWLAVMYFVSLLHQSIASEKPLVFAKPPKYDGANAKRFTEARSQRLKDDHMDADVIIVGAGTAGAALATVLARQGRHVMLIERSEEVPVSPHDCTLGMVGALTA
jgi:hypothetical protein